MVKQRILFKINSVPRGCLQFVIVVFPDHTHLLFLTLYHGISAKFIFGGHFGCYLEFQYEESTSRLHTQARKFAHCIILNIKPSNLFSGGGGTNFFAHLASALIVPIA